MYTCTFISGIGCDQFHLESHTQTDNWPSWYGDDLEAPNNKKFMKKIEQFQPFSDMDNYVLEERYLSLVRVIGAPDTSDSILCSQTNRR